MKKNIILSFLIMMLGILNVLYLPKVNAETFNGQLIDGEKIPGMYVVKLKPDGSGKYKLASFIRKSTDNSFVYCLQAFVDINNNYTYNVTHEDYETVLKMTPEQWKRVSLLAYYGYQYGNHTDPKWYYITQVMIWRVTDPTANIYFTKTLNGPRDDTLYASQIAELEQLVANHYTVPNFDDTNLQMTIGEFKTLTDSNNVLSKFKINNQQNVSAEISGNHLNITAAGIGDLSLTLINTDAKYTTPPLVYFSDNSQNAMEVGSYDPISISLHGNIVGGKIKITKVDSENNSTTPQGLASLVGARYNVLNSRGDVVTTLTIGEDGTAETDYLPKDTYTIQEISSSTGYYLDNTIYTAVVDSSEVVNVTVKENVIKGKIKIKKIDTENKSCSPQGKSSLAGAKFQVLNSKNEIVDTLVIGDDCTATSKELPYDNYTVQETESGTGYFINNSVFQVNLSDNSTQEITVENKVIKGKIKIKKIDNENKSCSPQGKSSLVGAKFQVLNSKSEVVDTLVIGDDCTATSKELPYDNYTVQETESGTGYKLNNNIFPVDILEDNTQEITVENEVIKGKIKITKVDSKTKICSPQGEALLKGARYQIINSHDDIVDTLTIGDDCTATSQLLPFDDYKIKEISSSTGYYLNTKIYSSSIIEEVEYPVTVVEDVIENKFQFYKFYGNANTGIIYTEANAEFDILNFKGEIVAHFKTDKDGFADVTLPYGHYTVKQTKGLEQYKLVAPFTITVDENTSLTQNSYIKNGEITARLKLVKIDSKTKEVIPVKGVKFKIKNKDTNQYVCLVTDKNICEFETNEQGVMITPLPLYGGNYEIEEIKAPYGYLLSSETKEFSIRENSEIVEDEIFGSLVIVEFEDEEVVGKLEIKKNGEKVIIEDGKFLYEDIPLPNVTFGLYDEKGNLVGEYMTDENGYLKVEDLKLGKYTFKELKTVDGYVIDENVYEFELKYKDQYTPIVKKNFELKNYLKKSNLEFTKSDVSTGQGIPNTRIEIYTENDELIFSGVTDENGKIVIEDLFVGKFYIIETEAATGYRLSDEKVFFEIKEDGKVVKAGMTNTKIKGKLEFTKTDFSTSEPLPNTLIEIYNEETNELVFSGRTDENGKITIELEYGNYYILEKEAPENYTLNEEKMYFSIKEDGEIVKATMQDKIIVNVPDTDMTDFHFLEIGSCLLIFTGTGVILYEKKKKN